MPHYVSDFLQDRWPALPYTVPDGSLELSTGEGLPTRIMHPRGVACTPVPVPCSVRLPGYLQVL